MRVDTYIIIENPRNKYETNGKRLKKIFRRKGRGIVNTVTKKCVDNFEEEGVGLIMEAMRKEDKRNIGIISDNNRIRTIDFERIVNIQNVPKEWDILCCESDISVIKKNNTKDWIETEISDTKHFIINKDSIHLIKKILKECKKWSEFIERLNKDARIYTKTQRYLSESLDNSVEVRKIELEENVRKFDEKVKEKGLNEYNILPDASIIYIANTLEDMYEIIYKFEKIEYPRDKLQLVIIDTKDIEKKMEQSNRDDRIRIINITIKNKEGYREIPKGYQYNIGVKYSDNKLLYCLTENESLENIKREMKGLLMEKHSIMLTGNSSIIFEREIWERYNFNDNNNQVFREFTRNKSKMCIRI